MVATGCSSALQNSDRDDREDKGRVNSRASFRTRSTWVQFRMPNAIVYWSKVLSAKSERCSALPRWNETWGAAGVEVGDLAYARCLRSLLL